MTTCRTLALGLVLASIPLLGCDRSHAGSRVPAGAAHAVLSLQEIECQTCGMAVVAALEGTAGVHEVGFDRDTAEVTVAYDPAQLGMPQLVAVAHELGYRASAGPGHGAYTPQVEFPADLDVQQISRAGEVVDIESFRAAGKVTVFDFHAIWCGPCKNVDRHMLAVLRTHPDVALRKLDIVDWDSAVAKAYLGDVRDIPYLVVYGRDGEVLARISGLDLDGLDAAIAKGRAR